VSAKQDWQRVLAQKVEHLLHVVGWPDVHHALLCSCPTRQYSLQHISFVQQLCMQSTSTSLPPCTALLFAAAPNNSPGGSSPPQRCPRGMMTEGEGATAEGQCSAPPGWFLPDHGSSSDMQECPSGTYKEVRRAGSAAAAVTCVMSCHCRHKLCAWCCIVIIILTVQCTSFLQLSTAPVSGVPTHITSPACYTTHAHPWCLLHALYHSCRAGTVPQAAHLVAKAPGYLIGPAASTSLTPTLAKQHRSGMCVAAQSPASSSKAWALQSCHLQVSCKPSFVQSTSLEAATHGMVWLLHRARHVPSSQ
jgi:hypothetical protein